MIYGKFFVWCDGDSVFNRMFKGSVAVTTGSLWWKKTVTVNIYSPIGFGWKVAETGEFINLWDSVLCDRFDSYCVRNGLYNSDQKIEHFQTMREID